MTTHTVLVVGATGHVGSQAAKELAHRGHRVRALVRSADKRIHAAEDLDIDYVVGDLADADSIDRAVRGATAIVSTANANIPDGRTPNPAAINTLLSDVLVNAAIRHDVERFVQSSVPVYDWADRHVPEIAGKRRIEAALEASPLDYTIVRNPAFTDVWLVMAGCLAAQNADPHATTRRPYGFMRTWQRLVGNLAIDHGRLLAPGGPAHGSPMIATRDVAAGMAAAVEAPNMNRRTISFGGPEWLTWAQIAQLIGDRIDRTVRPVPMPAWLASAGRAATKPLSPSASNVLALVTYVARHQPRWNDADIVAELGIPPRQTVAHYLDQHLQIDTSRPTH